MNKNIIKDALMLTFITLAAGLLLGFVYEITEEPIAKQNELTKQKAYKAVFSEADSFEAQSSEGALSLASIGFETATVDEAANALDANGNVLGFVYTITTSEGYGGNITITIGIDNDGAVKGVEFLTLSETAGLGMKAKEDSFKNQYVGKTVDKFTYTKNGAASENEIDAISGATITTSAVTNAVNAGIALFDSIQEGGTINE